MCHHARFLEDVPQSAGWGLLVGCIAALVLLGVIVIVEAVKWIWK